MGIALLLSALAGCVTPTVDRGPERDAARATVAAADEAVTIQERMRVHRAQLVLVAEAAEQDATVGRDALSAIVLIQPSEQGLVISQIGCANDRPGAWEVRDRRTFGRDGRIYESVAARCGGLQDRTFVFDTTLWRDLTLAMTAAGSPPDGLSQSEVEYLVNGEMGRGLGVVSD
ncbi:MAG: hypothetical protein HQ582_30670 [Planctomycetes bacterium]|nr:hypothetical protein [Planctomycetota bacterium]